MKYRLSELVAHARWLSDAAAQRKQAANLRLAFIGNGTLADECERRAVRIEAGDRWGAAREMVMARGGDWAAVAREIGADDAPQTSPG